MLNNFFFPALFASAIAFAQAPPASAATCTDLKSCAKVMNDLTGQRYMWEQSQEKTIVTAPDLELTKDNAEMVFTAMLDQAGLARVPVGDGKTFRVLPGAMRKEIEMPIMEASADRRPDFGKTWDWVTMRYKTKSREMPDNIEQAYRLHLPREARMQADLAAGYLIVAGSTPVVRHMYEVIKAADVPYSPAVKSLYNEREKKWRERQKAMTPKP